MKNILFSEQIDSFQSVCDSDVRTYFYIASEPYMIDSSGNILRVNGGYKNESSDSYIKMIVNQDYPYTKVYDNVELYFSNANQTLVESAWFTNSKQGSLVATSTDFDIREATHKLAIPRASSDLFADRMRDKYLVANYLIKRDAANGYYFSLPYIKTKYRYSSI